MEFIILARSYITLYDLMKQSICRFLTGLNMLLTGSPAQRRRVRQELARITAGLFGDFPISDDYKMWRNDSEFISDYRRLSPGNPYSEERKYALREFVRFTQKLPGDMAECGCYVGVSAYFMAKEAPLTNLFLFDSFEGLPEPENRDAVPPDVQAWKAGDMSTSEEMLRNNLREFDRVDVLKGWIPSRFGEIAERHFRLVHIDVDLYRPTLDSLRFFYPRMVPGGVIVMDDYGYLTCPGATQAAREFMNGKPEYILQLPTGQGVIIRGNDDHGTNLIKQ